MIVPDLKGFFAMNNSDFFSELSLLIISVALLAMITLLLALHIIAASDALVGTTTTALLSYWFLRSAFKWQGPSAPSSAMPRTIVSGAYNPIPPRASAARPSVPPQGGDATTQPVPPAPTTNS